MPLVGNSTECYMAQLRQGLSSTALLCCIHAHAAESALYQALGGVTAAAAAAHHVVLPH
jgi:hypothetical protein